MCLLSHTNICWSSGNVRLLSEDVQGDDKAFQIFSMWPRLGCSGKRITGFFR
jgi:hypothetical protein